LTRLVKSTFWLPEDGLEELRRLSRRSGVSQGKLMREALRRLLKRYRHITTMQPFTPHEEDVARYLIGGTLCADEATDERERERQLRALELVNSMVRKRRRGKAERGGKLN